MDRITYFPQTQDWADFWLLANGTGHFVHRIELDNNDLCLVCLVYEYPWHLRQNLLFVPQGPVITGVESASKAEVEKILTEFLGRLEMLAGERNSVFAKIDLDSRIKQIFELENDGQAADLIRRLQPNPSVGEAKILMYNKTYFLDLAPIYDALGKTAGTLTNGSESKLELGVLAEFMQHTNDFWLQRSKDIRNSTRRSLQENWRISTAKDEAGLDDFWHVFLQTQQRQNFPSHPKEYFWQILQHPNSRLTILRDEQDQPQSAWLGWAGPEYLTYLHGGNTQASFDKFGQYLIHLIAIYRCWHEHNPWYDMGGYQIGSGFAKFKDKYKGQLIQFPGPTDILYQPFKYRGINQLTRIAKLLRR